MNGKIHRFKAVTSTQDVARLLLAEGSGKEGDVVVAEEQTAGRGRFGRTWCSPLGGLYATFIIRMAPLISIRVGVSIVAALERFGLRAKLKWPNDIVIGQGKLGGVIIETAGELALVGIGINLRRSPLPTGTSASEQGVKIGRDPLLDAISDELRVERRQEELLDAYQARSATIGLPVSIGRGRESAPIVGIARGIDAQGRLLVETPEGICTISSGECLHLRPQVDAGRLRPLS